MENSVKSGYVNKTRSEVIMDQMFVAFIIISEK
jgi:hypothetical protein